MKFVEKSNPEKLEEIKREIIIFDGEVDLNIEYQKDYMKYQEFFMQICDYKEKPIVYISGTESFPFEDEWG